MSSSTTPSGASAVSNFTTYVFFLTIAIAIVATIVSIANTIAIALHSLTNLVHPTNESSVDAMVTAEWARYTSKKFNWFRMRYEITFMVPAIFLEQKCDVRGLFKDRWVSYIDGTRRSCEQTGSPDPDVHGQSNKAAMPILGYGIKRSLATWVTLLEVIQKMEGSSAEWEKLTWRIRHETKRPELRDVTDLAVGVQRKEGGFNVGSTITRPYAITTIGHLVELVAFLGLHWKEFNQYRDSLLRYHAEGNGYQIIGTWVDGFGLVFSFEGVGQSSFKETRVIPTPEIRELCFGNMPTFYRGRGGNGQNTPVSEQPTLYTLQLGSHREIADFFCSLGCGDSTISLYLRGGKNNAHIFPVAFELIGMLGKTLHIRNRCLTYLPNPTVFAWNRRQFSLRRLLDAFCKCITEMNHLVYQRHETSRELKPIHDMALRLNTDLPEGQDGDYAPLELNQLHDTLDQLDKILIDADKNMVLDVLRYHFQEVLLAVTTPSFDDLFSIPREFMERNFMRKYILEIRMRVITRHLKDYSNRLNRADLTAVKESRNRIWYTLVFRMVCWLLLHNFHRDDVQIPKSEFMGNCLQVYIR